MSIYVALWEIRLRRCGAHSRIWEVTLFPVVGNSYDQDKGVRTRMMFSTLLPFDEFWFDFAALAAHQINAQPLPPEVLEGIGEFVAHVNSRHDIVAPCMKPSAEPPAQSF
ncbi:hypothetical protein [Cryobacterium shii]|uniref:Uncharacterized protein n=1 Tax=Cryobacterium shii TaxID=1259235 RepID=A0AAQ2HFZ7_9MICO|nr:hypothetical protein [Cryobacterium shii]TFC48929.1 hypothetical protein E3O49_06885 [Cryobacterium shii]